MGKPVKKPVKKVAAPKKAPAKKPVAKVAEEKPLSLKIPRTNKMPQTARGFKDILPVDQKYWDLIRRISPNIANAYSFERIDVPVLEEVGLFARTAGPTSDIVQKEMFTFEDKGGDVVALRPEATASVTRAYVNHGMLNLPQPVKLWYLGPMFRYERPQSGRYRQFHQVGYEVIGDSSPVIDAQLIIMAHRFLKECGIETVMQINSLGTPADRKAYTQKLVAYYKTQQKFLDDDQKETLKTNPLRLLDSKDEKLMQLREDAPQIMDFLSDDSKKHLERVLEYLDELEVPYELNPYLVRGLDYYTQTVFEIWPKDDPRGGQLALGGGGRYDLLVEQLGGRPTPAAGFALGLERVILKVKELEVAVTDEYQPQVMVAQLGEDARKKAMGIFEQLRLGGINVIEAFSKGNLKQQLDIANKRGVRYTIIIGSQELHEGVVMVRDMEGGMQETVPFNKVVKNMMKRFGKEE